MDDGYRRRMRFIVVAGVTAVLVGFAPLSEGSPRFRTELLASQDDQPIVLTTAP